MKKEENIDKLPKKWYEKKKKGIREEEKGKKGKNDKGSERYSLTVLPLSC